MTTDAKSISVIGNIQCDLVLSPVSALPPPGEERFVERTTLRPGGSGGVAGSVLAAAAANVRVFGTIGRDPMGHVVLELLRQAGVETSDIYQVDVPTSLTVAMEAPERERAFLTSRGHMDLFSADDLPAAALDADITLLTGYFTVPAFQPQTVQVAEQANANGSIVLFDPGSDQFGWSEQVRDRLMSVLEHCDCFLPNEAELLAVCQTTDIEMAFEILRRRFDGCVIVKRGGNGCLVSVRGSEKVELPTMPVDAPDTTGAGDSFDAGVALGLSRGLGWVAAARLGLKVATRMLRQPPNRRYLGIDEMHGLLSDVQWSGAANTDEAEADRSRMLKADPTPSPPSRGAAQQSSAPPFGARQRRSSRPR